MRSVTRISTELQVEEAKNQIIGTLRPPARLKISEWADQKRFLSPESSAEPGKYYTERAEYCRGIMDAFSDPAVEEVVIMSSSQVGKTTLIENIIGFYVDQDPSPILMIQPTLDMAKVFSTDRLTPMLRDNPCLEGRVHEVKSRDSKNTMLHKVFPGGFIAMAGANSPASLASRPVRIVLQDEVDRYPPSAGKEGDPSDLADKRATTFWNRKKCKTSTPTIKGLSRIEKAYQESDMRKYWVPCPYCGEFQILIFGQIKWPKDEYGRHRIEKAYYECSSCQAHISDADKLRMVRLGEWRASGDFNRSAGFALWEGYSPWSTWAQIVEGFLKAKRGGREMLKVWTNTCLGQTWEEEADSVPDQPLYQRREIYGPEIPERACVLTAGIDVQDDRLECQVVAWGPGFESWVMDYRIFRGNTAQERAWEELDEYLLTLWTHQGGSRMTIKTAFIDAMGHRTERVYKWVKSRQERKIYAIRGSSHPGDPLVGRPSKKNVAKILLFSIGTDTAKDMIYARLRLEEPGPGYIHFRECLAIDEEYFKQLTAEKVSIRYKMGKPYREWTIKQGQRNEALDTFVYATAALDLLNPNFKKIAENLEKKKAIQAKKPEPEQRKEESRDDQPEDVIFQEQMRRRKQKTIRRGGFVNGWR